MTRRKTNYSVILLISSSFTDNSAWHQTLTERFLATLMAFGWEEPEKREWEKGGGKKKMKQWRWAEE